MSNELINFEELEDLRQSNIRDAQYELKSRGEGKFTISNKGKAIIGHDPTRGANVKGGKGVVVIGCLDKDDKRCTRGLLNGVSGNNFTSALLENMLKNQGLEAETYRFEGPQEYDGINYFRIVPDNEEAPEKETPAAISEPAQDESQDQEKIKESINVNDEF